MWYIAHYGVGHLDGGQSGRYPWGSGERPNQSEEGKKLPSYKKVKTEEAHTIPKGTKMYRVVSDPSKDSNTGSTYVTYQDVDRNFYRAYIKSRDKSQKVYEKTYKLKEDLKIPSQKELKEVQEKVLKNEKYKKQATDSYVNQLLKNKIGNVKLDDLKKDFDEVQKIIDSANGREVKASYYPFKNIVEIYIKETGEKIGHQLSDKTVNNYMLYKQGKEVIDSTLKDIGSKKISDFQLASASLAGAKDVKNEIIKELKSRGYNAMVDEAGVGVMKNDNGKTVREGKETLIVFDQENSLEEKKTKEVKSEDTYKSYRDYIRYINKNRYRD